MHMYAESECFEDYVKADEWIDYSHRAIQGVAHELFKDCKDEVEKIKCAFEYVRDEIAHSWDIQSTRITRSASEVLVYREGMCYAKAMLLAALLRSEKIPTGFCYQKLTLGDTHETGYCVHGLNAVYIKKLNKWMRLDARGNTNGKNAQFRLDQEQLAFEAREEYEEVDYEVIYKAPHPCTIKTLEENDNCIEMIQYHLPTQI